MVYDAEFKMRASEMAAFPKRYEMAALIPFDNNQAGSEIVVQKNLIKVSIVYILLHIIIIPLDIKYYGFESP